MKTIKRILLFVIALTGLAVIAIFIYLQTSKPVYSGTLDLKGLSTPVTVYHDEYGVPHIYGSNEEDTYRAFGYLVAQERLFQMELLRRVSSGRLSEILGSSMTDVDKFFRMLDINAHADSSARFFFSSNDQAYKRATLAYLDGINQYIENGPAPVEFRLIGIPKEHYTIRDLFLIVDYMAFNFQMGFRTDPLMSRIERTLGPEYIKALTLGYTPDQLRNPIHEADSLQPITNGFASVIERLPVSIWTGSNAFAIAPSRSSSGKTLLENDTHIGQQQPGVWFEAHLNYPGFDFYGSHLAGFPFAPMGHTPAYGWGVTMLENDDVDFYAEKISGSDSNTVLIRGRQEQMKLRLEVIHVKDSADLRITCRSTSHGPVCSDFMKDFKGVFDGPVSVCWTLLKFPCNLFGLTYDLARAGTMNEFKSGVSQIISPGLNVIYGDSSGNIAWYSAGKLVKRPAEIPNSLVLDGSDSATEWLGYYGFDDNPKSENPSCGFVYSCNHQPDTIHGIFHQGYYLTDERARRLSELLQEKDKYNLEDLQRIVYDHRNPELQKIVSSLFALTTTSVQEQETVALSASRLLHEWKGTHETDESAPVIYYMWLYKSLHDCMADELGEENFLAFLKTHTVKYSIQPLLKNDTAKWWDDVRTPEKENARDIVSHAFEETVSALSGQFGKDPGSWKWGDMHKLEFVHPVGKKKPMNLLFNVGPFAAAGGIETIDNQSFTLTDKFPATVMFGPALRRCIDFAKPLDALNVLPSGQSGNPMSRHYNDQAKMYVNGHFRKDLMDEQEIKSICKEVLVFK